MIKRYKALLTALLAVLLVFAVITVTGVVDINKIIRENQEGETSIDVPSNSFEDVFSTFTAVGLPLLKTDVENVFYSMAKDGKVDFYRISDGVVEKLTDVKVINATVVMSGQKIPVTLYTTVADGRNIGYGLFTNENHPDIFLYEYAFFKVTDQFDAYDSRSELLLLADIEKERFYDENKVYSESFYLYSDYTSKVFLNEDQRIVDLNARLRTDYKMFTDSILHQDNDKILFFSSRFYNDFSYSDKTDIFISGGYGENVDNNRYILDVASLDFFRTEKGVYYFADKKAEGASDEEESVSGFSIMLHNGNESEEIISFEGSLENDFILSGTKLFNKKTGEIYDVLTGDSEKLDYSEFETSFSPDMFKVSENGKYCVVRGKSNLGKPSLGIMDFDNNKFHTFTDNVFGHIASIQILNDGSVVLSLAAGETAASYYQLIANVNTVSGDANTVG